MKRNLFDFGDRPSAEIIQTSQCFIEVETEIMEDSRYVIGAALN